MRGLKSSTTPGVATPRNAVANFEITSLETEIAHTAVEHDLERISVALDELAKTEPPLAELVDLKFFCGLTFAEIASLRGVSERTVQRQWDKARIYLHHSIRANSGDLRNHVHTESWTVAGR